MSAPVNREEFLDLVRKSGVLDPERLDSFARSLPDSGSALEQPQALAQHMIREGLLTHFQAKQLLAGKWRRFMISGKYKLLEILGIGGMGSVYLCEHIFMRRLVAIKVLQLDKMSDPSAIPRFYREARVAGALDHPNIVRSYDIDQDDKVHFLVMEYVDGSSLQEIVAKHGAMDPIRAAHYIRQAALGLQHAHEAGLVHRDVKPGNLLLDRTGTVKLLDLGLARFFSPHKENVTEQFNEKVILGTADYLAPEQAISNAVDIRADIYSLGGTFYFLLSGKAPFEDGTITQKLLRHQTTQPKSLREQRPEIPDGLVAVIERMMAKSADDRPQTPNEVAEALVSWTQTPIPIPPDAEMPQRSRAALTAGAQGTAPLVPITPPPRSMPSTADAAPTGNLSSVATRNAVRPTPVPGAQRSAAINRTAGASPTVANASAASNTPVVRLQTPRQESARKAKPDTDATRTLLTAAAGGGGVALVIGILLWWFVIRTPEPAPIRPQTGITPPAPKTKASYPLAQQPPGSVITPDQAAKYVSQRCTIEMTVQNFSKATRSDRYYLNTKANYQHEDNFTVTFTKPVFDQLRARNVTDPKLHFEQRIIRVTGVVTEYFGRLQIEIDDLSQIEFVDPKSK